jgi:branched-chain amino acid transport system substrate-binding protein
MAAPPRPRSVSGTPCHIAAPPPATPFEFISLDDGYNPSRTVEDARRLLEGLHVDFFFSTLGTPTNSAIAGYLNRNRVPQLFVASGANKWSDYKKYPWTIGWAPSSD